MITVERVTAQDGLSDAEYLPTQGPTTGEAVSSLYGPLQPRQTASTVRRPRRKPAIPAAEAVHCPTCQSAFDSTTAFDDHRTGPIDNRRCATDSNQTDTQETE